MLVGKIGHASLLVSTPGIACFVDPVLFERFAAGTNAFFPQVRIDRDRARRACDAIFITHCHPDHFSPRTLDLFDRSMPVVIPSDDVMEGALTRLGFSNVQRLAGGEEVELADMTVHAIESDVPFPEIGFAFRSGRDVAWDLADIIVSETCISSVLDICTHVDVLLATYQPLMQQFHTNSPGGPVTDLLAEYGTLVRHVLDVAPRCVVPASCGFSYTVDWLNDLGFPMSEQRFLSDVARILPGVHGTVLPSGASIDVETLRVDPGGVPFVRRVETTERSSYAWRPDRGVPPLSDPNLFGLPEGELRRRIDVFLDTEFLGLLRSHDSVWRNRMARGDNLWRLEIVFPSGSRQQRDLRFTADPAWLECNEREYATMRTCIAASALVGLLDGELDMDYAVPFGFYRFVQFVYEVHRAGVSPPPDVSDPLLRVLRANKIGTYDTFIDREVFRIVGR